MTPDLPSQEFNEAFEAYRAKRFGPYASYPIDAYTYFGVGWKARDAVLRTVDHIEQNAWDKLVGERDRLRAEVERLTGERDHYLALTLEYQRAALEPKP